MSKYDHLREMREARLKVVTKPLVTKPALAVVTKPKGGRPCIGDRAMTAAERKRRSREAA